MDCGEKERSLHHVFLSDTLGLRLVCEAAELAALYRGRALVCRGAGIQAHGHHASFCSAAARLLAAEAGIVFLLAARLGKVASTRALRSQRSDHRASAAVGRWGAFYRAVL